MLGFNIKGLFSPAIAIDMGTANTLVAIAGKGIVIREPSAIAISTSEEATVLAIGRDALAMLGRTPGGMKVVYPMRDGVVADIELAEAMMKYYITRALGHKVGVWGVDLMLCLPMCVTQVERRALSEAAKGAGARRVRIMEEPLAAAIGAGMPVEEPFGSMIVDIGGGTTDAAVIALGGIASSCSVRYGGVHIDAAIIEYVSREYGVTIGERTAEEVKKTVGCAEAVRNEQMQVRGRELAGSLPVSIGLGSLEICRAITPVIKHISSAAVQALSSAPPELAGDIMQSGITICGGGSLLFGMDACIARETGIRTMCAPDALDCVAIGALDALCTELTVSTGDYGAVVRGSMGAG